MTSSPLLHTGLNSHDSNPLRIVGAAGVHFELEDGRRVIDASNTAGVLGHSHPAIVSAVRDAAGSPVINEGWLWPDREAAARDLVESAFAGDGDWVGAVRFFLSGSEANDLALSLCQALTGRTKLVTRERAYHGMTGLARDMTVQPHWHGGLSRLGGGHSPAPRGAEVAQIAAPRGERIGAVERHLDREALDATLPALEGAAAVILDYSQGGVYHVPEYQDAVADAARRAGTLWIADEVVTGFGRIGDWFAYRRGSSRPDIVTLGKPLAAGGAPAGAVVVSRRVLDELEGKSWQTYSTFRGHPLTVAAIRAQLRTLQSEGLIERVAALDPVVHARMAELAARHPSVVRIDGEGLHWTVELAGPDWRSWHGDQLEAPLATRVSAWALEHGTLFGTSGEPSSLFLAPPLIISEAELESALGALDEALTLADREIDEAAATG